MSVRLWPILPNRSAARLTALPSGSAFMSASVTFSPCQAHQAAMSPPMAPAPITCTRLPGPLAARETFELLAQKKHPHEIARRVGHHQPRERRDLGLLHGDPRRRRGPPTGRSARTGRDSARSAPSLRSRRACGWRRACVREQVLMIVHEQARRRGTSACRRPHRSPPRARAAPASPRRPGRAILARPARSVRPVSIMVMASIGLIRCGARTVPPRPGCRPSITSGNPNRASSSAMR